jgi:hypothetical protein
MKIMLEIPDNKASFFLEVLKSFSFVKTINIIDNKAKLTENIKESIEELKLIRQGKLKGIPAKDLIN